jgi:vacuolar-type H+-ATPase subunit E/Vma4
MIALAPTDAGLDGHRAELEPVRDALLEDAKALAHQMIVEATREATLAVDEAEQEADTEIRRAERRGKTSARVRADQTLAQARGDAHGDVLEHKEDIRRRFHRAVRVAALGLEDDVRYPNLIDMLEVLARNQLGPTARIERDPDGLGGLVAVDGSRRVDYTLPALAERALESLADKVAQLWA